MTARSRRRVGALATLLLLAAATASTPARAHLLNMTRVGVDLDADGAGELVVAIDLGQSLLSASDYWALAQIEDPALRARRLAPVLARLDAGIAVRVDDAAPARRFLGAEFEARSLETIRNPLTPQMATLRWALTATPGTALEVSIADDLEVPWPTLVRSDSARRELPVSRLLTADRRASGPVPLTERDLAVSDGDGWTTVAGVYAFLGIQHIVPLGLDHVLFILGLFFVGGSLRQLLLLVSCFTAAHTVSLAASTLGVVSLPATIVEPLIAASIVYIGLEGLFGASPRAVRLAVVFAFGLLHGLGFAGVLAGIGLPEGQFLLALLSFNVGVELGQVAVLALAFAAFGLFRSRYWYAKCISAPGATLISGAGLYWLLQRIGG